MIRIALLGIMIPFLSSCKDRPETQLNVDTAALKIDTVLATAILSDTLKPLVNKFSLDTLYKYFDTVCLAGKPYFVTEGDYLLTPKEFKARLAEDSLQPAFVPEIKEHREYQNVIILYDEQKKDTVKWKKFPLTFCIDKKSFSTVPQGYETVKSNILSACTDWSRLCNVSFKYVAVADDASSLTPYNLDFVVRYHIPTDPYNYAALSFFPNDLPEKRILMITPLYWTTMYDKTGIFRHEIGHIFGFRHEQTSKMPTVPLDCRQRFQEQNAPSRPITIYDKKSVMHYFCGGAGTTSMIFSKWDTIGFTQIYGKK